MPRPPRRRDAAPDEAPDPGLPDRDHIVAEPLTGAAQGLGATLAGGFSVILPLLGNLFRDDGSLSPATATGLAVFLVLVGWAILQAMGRARQRKVFWEAAQGGLVVHMDNIGPLRWDQVRAVRPVTAGPGWLTGNPVVAVEIHPWMPMDIRRRMKPDPDVRFFVRGPVMAEGERYLRLPVWGTKLREHGREIAARLEEWRAGDR